MPNLNAVAPRSESFKVLVVDDSAVYRHLINTALSNKGYELRFAEDGRKALRVYEEYQPDVVITDWEMPDVTGPELCREIRKTARKSYCYIILLTAQTKKDQVVEGLAAGADDFLTKPFHEGELLARLGVGRRTVDLQHQLQIKNKLLEQLALTDGLTNLPNRRAMEQFAARELYSAARHKFQAWAVMADLDQFKNINDTYGHDTGDLVLRGFADVLKANTRRSNLCGRFGGEEFLIILTHIDRQNVSMVVERIRKDFESRELSTPKGPVKATASFGIAGFEGLAKLELGELLSRADGALYTAKRNGRNRVEHYS